MPGSYAKSMCVNAVDELEIVNIVKGSHNKSSYGYDGIDVIIFFKVIDLISMPLCHIFYKSFEKGTFPNKIKISTVIPIFKTDDRTEFTNCRPVSLLPSFFLIYLSTIV